MPDLITRYAAPVPRYTSYPTPFCDTLCWFCGCNTKITRQYQPITNYLKALDAEIATLARTVPRRITVRHIHWGGGSPTILSATDLGRLMDAMRRRFNLAEDLEFAVEIDPRGLDRARIDALAEAGLTRVSIGVQDFDRNVQVGINRIQTVDETRAVIDAFRDHGVASLNIDAIYGLPGQHEAELIYTLTEVVRMRPDRIALFGYAHVPWMKRHQARIREADLPDVVERHNLAETAAAFLIDNGYIRIGIDHFARPHDALAVAAREERLRRNFQGYTVDEADALIGLGASSIGRLPQGYVRNAPAIADYSGRVASGGLAVTKGLALSEDDAVRAHVIERLMCDLAFRRSDVARRFGLVAQAVIADAALLVRADRDGLVRVTDDGFAITERGRPFARAIAARFDAYLASSRARHSLAV